MNTLFLFDFDGTIMDTEPAILASFRHLFETYRSSDEFTPQLQVEVLGPSLQTEIPKLFPQEDPNILIPEYIEYQKTQARRLIHPFDGAKELLMYLRKNQVPVGIFTTRLHESLVEILAEQGMLDLFSVLIGRDDVQKEKPHPEGIFKAMHMSQSDACVYTGDSAMDIGAGKAAGAFTIGIVTNEGKRQAIADAGPDAVIEHLDAVHELIKAHPQWIG